MKIKKLLLPIWWLNRDLFPLRNKYNVVWVSNTLLWSLYLCIDDSRKESGDGKIQGASSSQRKGAFRKTPPRLACKSRIHCQQLRGKTYTSLCHINQMFQPSDDQIQSFKLFGILITLISNDQPIIWQWEVHVGNSVSDIKLIFFFQFSFKSFHEMKSTKPRKFRHCKDVKIWQFSFWPEFLKFFPGSYYIKL